MRKDKHTNKALHGSVFIQGSEELNKEKVTYLKCSWSKEILRYPSIESFLFNSCILFLFSLSSLVCFYLVVGCSDRVR